MRPTHHAATAAALLLTLTACTSNQVTSKPKTPDATVTPATETPAAEEAEDKAIGLTDTATYQDGIEVSLSGFTRGVSSEYASPENTPYIKFTVKVTNGAKKTLDLNELYIACQYGDEGKEGEEIFDEGLDGAPMTHLRPTRSITAPIACELPKAESYVQIEVAPSDESETAIFAGKAK